MAGRRSAGPAPAHDSPARSAWEAALGEINYATFEVAVNITSVAGNTASEQTFTCAGVLRDDIVVLNPAAMPVGLQVLQARVSAKDTIAVRLYNTTGSAIDPGEAVWKILAVRM